MISKGIYYYNTKYIMRILIVTTGERVERAAAFTEYDPWSVGGWIIRVGGGVARLQLGTFRRLTGIVNYNILYGYTDVYNDEDDDNDDNRWRLRWL